MLQAPVAGVSRGVCLRVSGLLRPWAWVYGELSRTFFPKPFRAEVASLFPLFWRRILASQVYGKGSGMSLRLTIGVKENLYGLNL